MPCIQFEIIVRILYVPLSYSICRIYTYIPLYERACKISEYVCSRCGWMDVCMPGAFLAQTHMHTCDDVVHISLVHKTHHHRQCWCCRRHRHHGRCRHRRTTPYTHAYDKHIFHQSYRRNPRPETAVLNYTLDVSLTYVRHACRYVHNIQTSK